MEASTSQRSPKKRGFITRLQALPEPTRRRIATFTVAALTLMIFVAWLMIPQTPKDTPKDDWQSLLGNLQKTWQSSRQGLDELTKNIDQLKSILSSAETSSDFKQAIIQEYTKDWLIFVNTDGQFYFKHPADAIITTSTDPISIQIRSTENVTWLQFTILPTSSPAIATSTRSWQLASSSISAIDFAQSATTTLIIETFSIIPEKL